MQNLLTAIALVLLVLLSAFGCDLKPVPPDDAAQIGFRSSTTTTWDIVHSQPIYVGDATATVEDSAGSIEISLVLDVSGSQKTQTFRGLSCGDSWTTGRFDQPDGGWVFFTIEDVCIEEGDTVYAEDESTNLQALQVRAQL